jgi:hypothetical protein
MLDVLRRLFDFADWQINHPAVSPPGDMLDASFDAQNHKINEIIDILGKIVRSDGTLTPNVVHLDAFPAEIIDLIVQEVLAQLNPALLAATSAAATAENAKIVALAVRDMAMNTQNRAFDAMTRVSAAEDALLGRISASMAEIEASTAEISVKSAVYVDTQNDMAGAAALAQDWAKVAADWAEYMPTVLPEDTLKWMAITGEHWSSRWWANKASNAFGAMVGLYLGAHSVPPTAMTTGEPLVYGAIYYDTDAHQMFVWTGAQWEAMWAPSRAVTASLYYLALGGQTTLDMKTADMNGASYTLSASSPEAVQPMVNGVRLVPQVSGPEGDYVVNNSTSVITFNRQLRAGDMIAVDIMVSPAALTPVQSLASKLDPLVFDGLTTTFAMTTGGGTPVLPQKAESLVVSLDGVLQEPGVGYTISGSNIVFPTEPAADARSFIVFLGK